MPHIASAADFLPGALAMSLIFPALCWLDLDKEGNADMFGAVGAIILVWIAWTSYKGTHQYFGAASESAHGYQCVHERVFLPGRVFARLILISLGCWLSALVLSGWNWDVQRCAWQLVLATTLIGALHFCMSYSGRWPIVGKAPFVTLLLLLPFSTDDRMPFAFQARRCGTFAVSMDKYAVAMVSVVCAAVLTYCAHDLSVTDTPPPAGDNQQGSGKTSNRCEFCRPEWLRIVSAALSMAYLIIVGFLEMPAASVAYHIIWVYLRPSYVVLFASYWATNSAPNTPQTKAVLCQFACVYFSILCPLADTPMLHTQNSECIDGELQNFPRFTYHENMAGKAAHRVEALCFYISIALSAVCSLDTGKWRMCGRSVEVLFTCMAACSWSVVVAVRVWPTTFDGVVRGQYFLLYGVVIATECYALLKLGTKGLVIEVGSCCSSGEETDAHDKAAMLRTTG
eukprot:TRINITY_DN102616_c0_g1_i1.p1 TRINITY_DN102616_c0_g1~~TRINITY_DN102616_c0_g1_i1.p1  ORF type:complete len:455 (-),score=13.13 TRINITY_DN102616_c0_g1_i1:85-1449(-)